MSSGIVDLLRFSGPMSLADLNHRTEREPDDLAAELTRLHNEGTVLIRGGHGHASALADRIVSDEDTTVELSSSAIRRLIR